MRANLNIQKSQAGMSILEVLLSVVILSAGSFWTLQGFNNIVEYQNMSASATLVHQFDQMAKKTLGRILQETMRENIDVDAGAMVLTAENGSIIEKEVRCDDDNTENDSIGSYNACQNFVDSSKECRSFNISPTLDVFDYEEVDENDQNKSNELFANGWTNYLQDKIDQIKTQGDSDPTTKSLLEAMERCQKNIGGKTGAQNNSMLGKSSFIGCIPGGSRNVFIEYRATLWDFHSDKPLLCEELHGNLGRGLQVYYQGWAMKFNAGRLKKGSKFYSVTRFGGNMSIPKIVFKRGLEKYVGQEANQQQ